MKKSTSLEAFRGAIRWRWVPLPVVALLALAGLPACIEVDPPPPPPPNDPVLAYAVFPSNLSPDALVVERGDVIEILGQPVPPRVNPDHEVNFANHFLIECVSNEDEHESDHWPPCSLAVAEGFVIIDRGVGRELSASGCNAILNYVPGGAINPSVAHCLEGVSGYTANAGPGVQWSGVWRVTGCEPTWITFRHTQSAGLAPDGSPALSALSDTTRITVAQPCGGG